MIFSLEAAVTRLTASPPDPSFAIETRDLTLVWDYILDGSVAFALFLNLTGGGNAERIARQLFGRSVIVEPKYQDRFTVVLTDSQASLFNILAHRKLIVDTPSLNDKVFCHIFR